MHKFLKPLLFLPVFIFSISANGATIPEEGAFLLGDIQPNLQDLENGVRFTPVDGEPYVWEAISYLYGTGVFGITSTPGNTTWETGAYKLPATISTNVDADNYIVLNLSDNNNLNYAFLTPGVEYKFILDYRFEDVFLTISKADFQPEQIMPASLHVTCITDPQYPYSTFTRQGASLVCRGVALSNTEDAAGYCGFFIGQNYGANWNTDGPFYETMQQEQNWDFSQTDDTITKRLYRREDRTSGINLQYVSAPGKYDFNIDFSTYSPVLTISQYHQGTQTGIEALESSTQDATTYYTLDGLPAKQPAKGVYLLRQGTRVIKVVL